MDLLETLHVTKYFNGHAVLNDINIQVKHKEFFTLLGPSGCGKTTLLRLIAGFDTPDEGQILLDGQDIVNIPPEKRPIHTVFQNYALFPHMSVADNIAFPLKMAGNTQGEIKSKVDLALDNVRLTTMAKRFPHELSGGQKQRVALARGLVNQPRLLLLDEPLGALDEKLRVEMQQELIKLQYEAGVTFVFITHSQDEALNLSDRIAIMNQGSIEQIETPSNLYNHPANSFVANFIGKINMLPASVLSVTPTQLTLNVTGLGNVTFPSTRPVQMGDTGVLAIRPEQVTMHHETAENQDKTHFMGTVQDTRYTGDVTLYRILLTNGARFEALRPNITPEYMLDFKAGDTVSVQWEPQCALFLNH